MLRDVDIYWELEADADLACSNKLSMGEDFEYISADNEMG